MWASNVFLSLFTRIIVLENIQTVIFNIQTVKFVTVITKIITTAVI